MCLLSASKQEELSGGQSAISSILGSNSSPAVRSIVCQVNEFSSTCFITLIIAGRTAVGQDAAIADEPAVAAVLPRRLGESPVGVERPGADRLRGRIPADDLHPAHVVLAVDGNLERPRKEVLVFRPVAVEFDFRIGGLVGPASNHPFQMP